MRKIDKVILHHSDSDIASHDDVKVIRYWHVDERGWSDIGYHYFIRKDGTVQRGRHLAITGAHCKGKNRGSVGICLSGRYKFTEHQFKALRELINRLEGQIGNPLEVYGHSDFDSKKDCPFFNVEQFKKDYLDA